MTTRDVKIMFDNPDIPPGTYQAKLVSSADGSLRFEVVLPKEDPIKKAIKRDVVVDIDKLLPAAKDMLYAAIMARANHRPHEMTSAIDALGAALGQGLPSPPASTTEADMRALRLWHWQQVRRATQQMEDGRCSPHTRKDANKAWTFHMGAVQTLNEFFPVTDTAENDAKNSR